jgi:hypothetical protein
MRVERANANTDSYRQTQYYAGEHLAYYYDPTAIKNRPRITTEDESGIFIRYIEKENGQRQRLWQSTTKQQQYFEARTKQAESEELLHRLNYKNGVHYSAVQKIIQQK